MNPIRQQSLDDIIGITDQQAKELGRQTANTLWELVQIAEYRGPNFDFPSTKVVASLAKDNMLLNCTYNEPQLDHLKSVCAEAAIARWNELLKEYKHDS